MTWGSAPTNVLAESFINNYHVDALVGVAGWRDDMMGDAPLRGVIINPGHWLMMPRPPRIITFLIIIRHRAEIIILHLYHKYH